MNIYLKELKNHIKSLIFWSLAIVFFLVAAMSKYQGFSKSTTSLNETIESLPGGLSAVFGIKGLLDLTSAGGYFALCVMYFAIMLGVHALLIGSGIIAKEETDKTIEFLYAKPISRNRILFTKLLAALTVVALLNIATLVSSIFIVAAFNEGPSINGEIVFLMPALFFIQLLFLMVGATFAAVMRRPKRAGMLAAAVLLATYIISVLDDLTDYGFLKYTTPFKYFDARTVFSEHSYSLINIIITVVVVTILFTVSGFAYKNRDFNV
jgi:ABC-2 type transport system permease protein